MIEKGFIGNKKFTFWIIGLFAVIGLGVYHYLIQLEEGLTITGMSRDISWGFYVANFTFFVGVAASAVILVIPYYLHHNKSFSKIVILGEWIAVGSVVMCIMFIMADMGQPQRAMNILLHPTPNSILFWDLIVLTGYLIINLLVGWNTLKAEKTGKLPPMWVKTLTYLSIPWAVGIHTVTAFLYAGLPGRHLWLTAILAPRFLASAFAAGPALLLALIALLKKITNFHADEKAVSTLGKIMLYAMITNIFFYAMEFFTAFYSNIPSHKHTLQYLFFGLDGHTKMVPWAWTSVIMAMVAILILLPPKFRNNNAILTIASIMIFIASYIDKGMTLVIGGFIPNTLETVTEYTITTPELLISAGIWATGMLLVTILYKMTFEVRKETAL